MNDDEQAMMITEIADETAMFIFREMGLDYDEPTNVLIAMTVRRLVSNAIDKTITQLGKGEGAAEDFEWRVSFDDALNWDLHGECLAYALVDEAIKRAPDNIRNNEEGSDISLIGNEIVVTLFAERRL